MRLLTLDVVFDADIDSLNALFPGGLFFSLPPEFLLIHCLLALDMQQRPISEREMHREEPHLVTRHVRGTLGPFAVKGKSGPTQPNLSS